MVVPGSLSLDRSATRSAALQYTAEHIRKPRKEIMYVDPTTKDEMMYGQTTNVAIENVERDDELDLDELDDGQIGSIVGGLGENWEWQWRSGAILFMMLNCW
jgi:hypothetical protein